MQHEVPRGSEGCPGVRVGDLEGPLTGVDPGLRVPLQSELDPPSYGLALGAQRDPTALTNHPAGQRPGV